MQFDLALHHSINSFLTPNKMYNFIGIEQEVYEPHGIFKLHNQALPR